MKKFPIAPAHPERNCWGCDRYCTSTEMACGNGAERAPHPMELLGKDWELLMPAYHNPKNGEADKHSWN